MKLKRLEITGFKSFREKVALDFADGISCVVGPNGCGKSNIVDAIRWVMGEQRVKSLRGKKMDDVIFNGSQEAAPVGMAEVAMTLTADGAGFPAAYAECSEVMVSRKIFRDGESEYAINKVPCRLLDVREFFMGTGVGARTYSLVEQNSVASLVEAKPEDRRQFIEEAAGISKYKSRKESAARKMEQTQQNLVRVHDIIREVKSQLNAVSRQARRAEQYKTLKQAIKEAELTLSLQGYRGMQQEKASREEALKAVRDRETALKTSLLSAEAAFQSRKVEMLDSETQLSQVQESLYQLRNAISVKEQGIAHATQKSTELSARMQKDLAEIESIRSRLETNDQEQRDLKLLTDGLQGQLAELGRTVSAKQADLDEGKDRQQLLYQDLDEKKIQSVDYATERVKLKNQLTGLQKGIEELQRRGERDDREFAEYGKRRQDLLSLLERLHAELGSSEDMSASLSSASLLAADELERAHQDLQDLEEEIGEMKDGINRKSARLLSLKEFQDGYEGCQDGVRSLMSDQGQMSNPATEDHGGLSRDTFCGLVADHIDVPREYETAVEAVLGDKLQYIIVKKQEDGLKAIDYLKNYALGRGSFVPLEVRHEMSGNALVAYDHLKEAVRLIDQVHVSQDFKGIADYLLGDVLLIPSLPNGITLWKQNGFRGTFVTPDGDIINPQGVLTGGNGTNAEKSLLRNRREMGELQTDLDELADSLRERTDRKREAGERILEWEEESRRLRADLHQTELLMAGKKKDLERFEDELNRVEQHIKILDFNREQARTEERDTLRRMEETRQALVIQEGRERSLNDRMTVLRVQWETLRTDLEKASTALTTEKMLLVSLEEKKEANLRALDRLSQVYSQLTAELETRIADVRDSEHQTRELADAMVADREALGRSYEAYRQTEETLTQRKAAQQELEASLKEREDDINALKKAIEPAVREISELEMIRRELTFKMENLYEGIRERGHLDVESLLSAFQGLDEEVGDTLRAKLDKDRQLLEQFGEVNLLALNEYEELKQRFDFLTAQSEDLHHSLETLQKTIARINAISRKRFAETFEAVNERFKEVFEKIFPGGKGELRLTDDVDMLETGVDIHLQIPGKKPQSISLLSGGEKSLAAIALIFAIILYRPTPYLVLDEVDAALDDANISLFNRLIKDISASSQIIMITHNKRTMEVASHLFGITMQQYGISTMVSVNLH